MPNHFHLMVYIKNIELPVDKGNDSSKSDTMTWSHHINFYLELQNLVSINARAIWNNSPKTLI